MKTPTTSRTSQALRLSIATVLIALTAAEIWATGPPTQAPDGAAERYPWRAGVSRKVITPEKSVWLAGYGTRRAPDGKLHDLWMKALALQAPSGRRAVLITSDFQGVPRSMSDRVFAKLKEKHQLERKDVMLTFSHNHCGPRLGDDLIDYYPVDADQEKLVQQYTDKMVNRCVELVDEALKRLAPARLEQGVGKTTFAVNRRNNKESDVPRLLAEGVALQGPVDHDVPVLRVIRPGEKMEAVLFGYACHPTTLSFLTWCGDYPGFAQLVVEKKHPGVTAMFVNTCGGDQNPLPRRTVELCEKYGNMLAIAVEQTLKKPMTAIGAELFTAFEIVDLDYLEVVSREKLHETMRSKNAIEARWAARLLQKMDRGAKFEKAYPYPVHAWQLGKEMLVIGMGAETVVDYALRFKKEFGAGTWVCGYADDMIAYIPSRRVWEEGGYEGGWRLYEYGRPAYRWAGDIEQRIADSVHKLVKDVRGEDKAERSSITRAKPTMLQEHGAGEGPAWHPELGLLTSGEGNINRRDLDGNTSVHIKDAGTNGLLFDRQGRLVICQPKHRRVARLNANNEVEVLADRFDGKRFNQPNDLTIDSQGRIYFSDPQYGDRSKMEMTDATGKHVEGVYRIDRDGKVSRIIKHEVDRPNGLIVTPDDRHLYVADNNNNSVGGARKLWRFELTSDGMIKPRSQKLIYDWKKTRGPDGMKLDRAGRLFVAAGLNRQNPPYEVHDSPTAGVYVFAPDGNLLEVIRIPRDETTNCAFGGKDLRTLFITAGGTLWSVEMKKPGRVLFLQ